MTEKADIVIIGAGAAGLMAGIWSGRTNPNQKIIALDSAKKLGAKILVSGGGRCNVTHDRVGAESFAGSSRNAIKKVLKRFDVPEIIEFFRTLGIQLKREETGKLFPISDKARTVLDALLRASHEANVEIRDSSRVETIIKGKTGFQIKGAFGEIHAATVILATGGRSLPKTGSDGHGYEIAHSLGHQISRRIFPALVPLTLPREHFICSLSGVTIPTTLELRSHHGKRLVSFTDSTLCTHFGLSGPSVLDFSRYYIEAKLDDPETVAVINWLPDKTGDEFERELLTLGKSSAFRHICRSVPERLARALLDEASIDITTRGDQLTREQRKRLTHIVTQLPLPITGNRGYTYAEVTAGGISLDEIHLNTMESRPCPGLHLCGEVCDVDGRIGGYNFQWAWASGYVAGISAGL